MAVIYTYDVDIDFPNSQVNLSVLTEEIGSSEISKELNYITVDDTECKIVFESSISSEEQSILDNIVSEHTGAEIKDDDDTVLLSGMNFVSASAEHESSTNSTNYIQRVNLNTSGLIPGNYRIGWYYEWKRESTSSNFMAKITLNGTTIMEQDEETKDYKSWHTEGGFYITPLSEEEYSIIFYFAGNKSRYTSFVRRVRLELWRVE